MELKKKYKSICIISDSYIPQKISAAGMIYNLSKEIESRNIEVTCVVSGDINQEIKKKYYCEGINFVTTNIFKKIKNKHLVFRFFYEIFTALLLACKAYLFFKKKKKLI